MLARNAQKMKFSVRTNLQFSVDLFTLTKEILGGKLCFFCIGDLNEVLDNLNNVSKFKDIYDTFYG